MSLVIRPLLFVLVLLGATLPVAAQSQSRTAHPQADRIAAHPDLRATTRLAGHVPAWANAANDAGPAPSAASLRLTFVLSRSTERQAAFTQLLADQQNPASPSYHHWLTPQQIGTLYGPTQNDLDALTNWLASQGLIVTDAAPSHIFLTVQAPAATVASALGTSFRNFNLRDPATGAPVPHLAATTNPAIPSAFATVVSSIDGLSDTPVYPMQHSKLAPMPAGSAAKAVPDGTQASSGIHYIAPADFAVLYDLNPAYNSGINGANQKVAVIGRSRVDPSDISIFESVTGLPSKQPNVIVPPAGVDPGTTNTGDQDEATLDIDRVFATAPGVQVDLLISTAASGGVQVGAQYEVQTLLDPVMNLSFSSCEANASASLSGVSGLWNTLFSQAAMEGISVFVSSDDSGAAGCQSGDATPSGTQARSINVMCASSFATCVGGTEFADFASPSTYWNSSNGTNLESARSYIPEGAWNEPTAGTTFQDSATGGGASTFILKPTWQTGTGVPADGFRDVPDVSFSSSIHNGYLICLKYKKADCISIVNFVGGTSAAAPAMAGIAAMLDQRTGGPQGNLNPLLYSLAGSSPSSFHDVTPATSGVATCDTGTPSMCNNSTPSPTALTGGLAGFALNTGYDQATGLGSLDVSNFLNAFASAASISVHTAPSSLTVTTGAITGNTDTLTVNSFVYGGSVSLGCTVAFNAGIAPSTPICSLNPASVALAPNGSTTSTLTIATSTPLPANSALKSAAATQPPTAPVAPLTRVVLGSLLLLILIPARRYRRSLRAWQSLPTVLLLLAGLGTLSACSGSSTPISPNPLLISDSGTSLSASAPIIFASSTDTFSVAVVNNVNTGFNTTVLPTGTVKLFQSGTTAPVGTITLANGVGTSTPITFTTPGSYTISAVYSGDNNFAPSNAASVPLTVVPRGTTPGSYTVTVNATTPSGLTTSTAIALTVQ